MRPIIHTYIEWRLTKATQFRLRELHREYEQVDEGSDDAMAITEMIQSLPGFPRGHPVDTDFLLVVTDVQN